ncbi:MAG: GWxTD domain-containing protein [Candidatus Aminicenantes bacterium]|jgi:GWxTD domain-containing protein
MFKKILFCLLLSGLCPILVYPRPEPGQKMPEHYRKWLEEEVVYIITARERDVFKKLTTDKEREIFIEAFWKQRDPTPGTPRNEFMEEFYQRRNYVNEYFGRGTPRPGWKTDQGRIYIILGPPQNIEDHSHINGVYPVQIWSYSGEPGSGLPAGFNIIFFKRHGTGEYILYSPVSDGPESLIADWGAGLMEDYRNDDKDLRAAYKQLLKLAPNLAYQTISLIPGERVMEGTVSLASEKLIGNVFSYPQKKVEDQYAEALLKYKDIIEVDYSANYIDSDASLQIIKDPSGFFMVHYSIEPRRISVEAYGETFNTNFELDGRISDLDGKTVYQYTKEFPLTFSAEEINDMSGKSMAIQDLFPLVPGTYKFDFLLKNTVSKQFTTFEANITIPGESALPAITPPLLGYQLDKDTLLRPEVLPFKVKHGQLLIPARKTFAQKEDLYVFFQILHLSQELQAEGEVKYSIFRRDDLFLSRTKKIGEYGTKPDILEVFPLLDFPPDYYKIRISVVDSQGTEVLAQDEDFEISAAPAVGRPVIVSKVQPGLGKEEYDCNVGLQLLNLGRTKDALLYLEKAYAKNPVQLKYGLALSQCLFAEGQYQRVKDILTPFREEKATDLVLYFLGKSVHSLGQLDEAITDYTDYLSRFGLNLEILNLLGTAHYQKGHTAEALRVWQRSLEINPEQENIKKLVQSLKEKNERNPYL